MKRKWYFSRTKLTPTEMIIGFFTCLMIGLILFSSLKQMLKDFEAVREQKILESSEESQETEAQETEHFQPQLAEMGLRLKILSYLIIILEIFIIITCYIIIQEKNSKIYLRIIVEDGKRDTMNILDNRKDT